MIYQDISAKEFKELSEKDGYVILDVRSEKEYAEGQIPGHILIDYFKDNFAEEIANLDPSINYLVYCRGGIRSAKACEIMHAMGFSGELYNLLGGIREWNEEFGKS